MPTVDRLLRRYCHCWALFLGLFMVLPGCDDLDDAADELLPSEKVLDQRDVYSVMNRYYYWYDQIPNLDPDDFSSVPEAFRACLWTTARGGLDKWSFILTLEEYEHWICDGEVDAFGATFVRYFNQVSGEHELRVGFVHQQSPMDDAGIERGYRLESINGIPVAHFLSGTASLEAQLLLSEGAFVFKDLSGQQVQRSLVRGTVHIHPADSWTVFTRAGRKTGYLMCTSFIVTPEEGQRMLSAFEYFDQQDIDDLIIDLRYNTGGDLNYARDFTGYFIPLESFDHVFLRLLYNDQVASEMNKVYYLKILQPALNLSRVVFITSSFTASASESVINGLLPHMEVIRVGTPTRGKPVGMNAFAIPRQVLELSAARWVLFPICFETRNRLHQGAYYDGLLPDISVQDDVLHPFGDQEACIRSALDYLETGEIPPSGAFKSTPADAGSFMTGFRATLGFY